MSDGFNGPLPDNQIDYLGLTKDLERSKRYDQIGRLLDNYTWANPTVPELDKIVPLPPAKLPHWDGKLKWLEEYEADIPPPLPSEARIREMAIQKGLDPLTGRKTEAEKKADNTHVPGPSHKVALGQSVPSGELCPQSGVWCADLSAYGVRKSYAIT